MTSLPSRMFFTPTKRNTRDDRLHPPTPAEEPNYTWEAVPISQEHFQLPSHNSHVEITCSSCFNALSRIPGNWQCASHQNRKQNTDEQRPIPAWRHIRCITQRAKIRQQCNLGFRGMELGTTWVWRHYVIRRLVSLCVATRIAVVHYVQ